MPVVVVIAHADPQPVARTPHASLFRHVLEAKSAQVPAEVVLRRQVGLGAGQGPAVEEVDIDQAVVVVVESRQPGGHEFDNVAPAAGAVGVPEADPRLFGDVAEEDRALSKRCR